MTETRNSRESGGDRPPTTERHDFEIVIGPKGSPSEPLGQRVVDMPIFPPKVAQKLRKLKISTIS